MTSSAPKPPGGHFSVLYFASAGSFTGRDSESLPAPLPMGKLFSELESRYPGIQAKILDSCLVTVNLDYVDVPEEGEDGSLIQEGDEVAIIPPEKRGSHEIFSDELSWCGDSNGSRSGSSLSTRLWNGRFHRDIHSQLITFCPDFRIFQTVMTAAATTKTAANVAKMDITTASAIPDETPHPRGLVLTSHRSSGCGQMLPAKAGASIGMAYSFGTHDHVCANKASIYHC
ncbi:hypothetical protein TrVFT333_000776 [Trichoderma virens FT-333]|nr:hypothetical protein TrVFT333_000776 [Trichoderma virens FT-333]